MFLQKRGLRYEGVLYQIGWRLATTQFDLASRPIRENFGQLPERRTQREKAIFQLTEQKQT